MDKLLLTDPGMLPGKDLLAEGRALASDWKLGKSLFLEVHDLASEAEYKRQMMADNVIMQHAHIGFRSVARTTDSMASLHDKAGKKGFRIDRFGITLDWTMGYPPDQRADRVRGTGIVLNNAEDFARITNASPAACHFGDFMLGLPAALHNTKVALAAGATSIGNIGQYFTFRLPYWDDDVATTEETVRALGLIAAQDAEVLVHSNLDDGFAGLFVDVTSALGMVLIEKYIVEDLIGAPCAFCYGHHFSQPLTRTAFHAALTRVSDTPGTMIFGNTVAYQSDAAANYASLANYLLADLVALQRNPSGHAINPVPVTENVRIPDIAEILDAQSFAARLCEHAATQSAIVDFADVDLIADKLVEGGRIFADKVITGLGDRGVDVTDPAALMLAIRRLGAREMERLWGAGRIDDATGEVSQYFVPADWAQELDELAQVWSKANRDILDGGTAITMIIGTTDVHEHGAYLVRTAVENIGVEVIDAGVAVDAEDLVEIAIAENAQVIAISTYNGVGLPYAEAVQRALLQKHREIPVLIGGKLNRVADGSNTDLPVDATEEIRATGAVPCATLDDMIPILMGLGNKAR